MNKKKYIPNMIFEGYGIELHSVTIRDLPSLRRWRNSPSIRREMQTTSYITPRQQRLWYEGIRDRVDHAYWVVWHKGVRTGYVNIKGEGPLELHSQVHVVSAGLYVGDSSVRHGLLGYAIGMLLLDIIFEHLSLSEYQGTVREENYSARRYNQQLGYREEGCKDGFVKVVITPSDYEKSKARLIRYFKNDK